jgi:YegS/Rv2252/BmrU family lipid kinase
VLDRPVCLIVNPSAGGGRAARLLPGVEAELRGLGASFRVERTTSMAHARELARGARDAGELVAAMGGDGLTGAVAGELAGGTGLLAVLPGGRGNDFARKLGIPHDPVAACSLLAEGRERSIDLAQAGDRCYLGILSAGFDSDVNAIANSTRLPLGQLVYVYAAVRALARWRPARWEVSVDGDRRAFTGYSVAVANSGMYGGGMNLVPDAELDDGRLDVVLCEQFPKRRALVLFAKVFKGSHVGDPGMTFVRAERVEFRADRPFTAYADGDPISPLPATVRVLPAALRVVAPA